jgi:hypothetical protein
MMRLFLAAILTGLLSVIMDGITNGNLSTVKLMECYVIIARQW